MKQAINNINLENVDYRVIAKKTIFVICAFYLMFISFGTMKFAFTLLGTGLAEELVAVEHNPFIYFFIGLLGAAVFQSSSAVTAIVVGAVGLGKLSLDDAVFIVMGANIGTTVTSTIVALSYIDDKSIFMRALSGAALHDFFNIFAALIFLPLELSTGFLSNLSQSIASNFFKQDLSLANTNSRFEGLNIGIDQISHLLFDSLTDYPWVILGISVLMLIVSLKLIGGMTKEVFINTSQVKSVNALFKNDAVSLFSGISLTAIVQSSSITSSLIVPLTASKRITLPRAYMFIMGANVGTTITALFAALATGTEFGVEIALTHVLFNVLGVVIFTTVPTLKRIPVWYASKLGFFAAKERIFGFVYLFLLFFVVPFILVWLNT
ncbi:Na/Pi symporter [Flammeovirga sp. SJP92]|uniref:Na/Pi symporter n=1 Tax=Flammeovirga sp. SJP92 TaxID=1775430 RepID=UPI0012F7CAAE|nr:Na/Pi symporter [Flammeovirga sp. SJP92]